MVNEELSSKSLHFVVDYVAKPAAREIVKSLEKICLQLKAQNQKQKEKVKTGKMPVKKLIKQGKGAQKIELDGEDIHLFNRLARKYGVDYAVVKDKEAGTYKIFFKAQDADAISDLVADYTRRTLGKEKGEKASVLGKLQKFKEIVASLPRKVAEKRKEQTR
ncbi:PcfB family protein [Pseudobutyrivibrio xylanivorans]|uniref:PcfB family protein n=1 Tax=Pseudobutyrivibrio xylanivorans TaxID=185007 RepID=A0A5P6VSH5_PSEXY|nr:PcfB family protein [Pseudobutyrivibrio xylanivorans]QFJ55238.1 PcfB family protein [Pseudobutyrivibrio xylanivorans]